MSSAVPEAVTDLFLALTPEKVLEAVEAAGIRCNPVCYALNSYENRVYEVELEDRTRLVSKFYRPGRWTREQILEEHQFMADLMEAEIPICGVRSFPDGSTLKEIAGIYYCLYDRFGGRAPDELTDAAAERLGMMVGRIHNVGAAREAPQRLPLTAQDYARDDLAWMQARQVLPPNLGSRYAEAAEAICAIAEEGLQGVPVHRIHGDFHLGNLLLRDGWFHALDFDDMMVGPAVQDLWMLLPGRGAEVRRLRDRFIDAYEQFRGFDETTLRLIEPLRGLRLIHYATWLARRWHDPVFPQTWPHYGTEAYWEEQTADLEDLLRHIHGEAASYGGAETIALEPEEELTNKDFFWDWEEPEKK